MIRLLAFWLFLSLHAQGTCGDKLALAKEELRPEVLFGLASIRAFVHFEIKSSQGLKYQAPRDEPYARVLFQNLENLARLGSEEASDIVLSVYTKNLILDYYFNWNYKGAFTKRIEAIAYAALRRSGFDAEKLEAYFYQHLAYIPPGEPWLGSRFHFHSSAENSIQRRKLSRRGLFFRFLEPFAP